MCRHALALIDEVVTLPTGKYAFTVENGYTSAARSCWTNKPDSFSAVVASCPLQHGNKLRDAERFTAALSQIAGKRLTFAEVTGKVGETPF